MVAARKFNDVEKRKERAKNFNQQKTRVEKFDSLLTSKEARKTEFLSILSQLKEAVGGNASSLACLRSTTSPAAMQLQAVIANLTNCQDNIEQACETNLPFIKTTLMSASNLLAESSSA